MPFSSFHLHKSLLQGLKELGFTRPTPIQVDAIPPAIAGRDVLACASTGSGKTAAFLLPILNKLIERPRGTTRALVVTPTRELAAQILEHLNEVAIHTPITAASVYGGVGMGPQEHAFRTGVDVIIATPGRLLDHLRSSYARIDKIDFLVLDEADRMLDMGFLPDIRRILKHVPAKRQTLFFSATMPDPIVTLTQEMLHNPVTINLQRAAAPAMGITQAVYPVPQNLKSSLLATLLQRGDIKDALVFTRTKHRADRLADYLIRLKIKAERIHGNRSQPQRTAALAGFKSGRYRVLVATDIAARGIDVEALGHVINFDVPKSPEDYIHRVGRTGRAELTGEAYTFVAPEEDGDLRSIERVVGKRLPRVTVPDFDYQARSTPRLDSRAAKSLGGGAPRGGARGGGASDSPRRGHGEGEAPSRGGASRPASHRPASSGDAGTPAERRYGRSARPSTRGKRHLR